MTDKPFPEALEELLTERDWSQRELARRTRKEAKWGSSVHISQLMRGTLPPSKEGMEIIAQVMRIRPETFAEYRLEVARDALDWRQHGVPKALAVLQGGRRPPRRRASSRGR